MTAKNRLIESSFIMLTAIAAWNLQLNSIALDIARFFGFSRGSFAEMVTTATFVPISITLIAVATQVVYRKLVWKVLPQSQYSAGAWVYVLIAQVGETEIPVAGWFILRHDALGAKVDDARAYYIDNEGLTFRGEWSSDAVWVKNKEIGIVFHMRALGIEREQIPSEYHGFIQIRLTPTIQRATSSTWSGHFHDLGERVGIHGPIAAKRLKRTAAKRQDHEQLITENIDDLKSSVLKLMGREKIRYKNTTSEESGRQ